MSSSLFAFALGVQEILILSLLGVLLFGNKMPTVGRDMARAILAFKEGLRGVEHDVETTAVHQPQPVAEVAVKPPERITASAPKFAEEAV
jgi:sec-independent protein translocase protein TatA